MIAGDSGKQTLISVRADITFRAGTGGLRSAVN